MSNALIKTTGTAVAVPQAESNQLARVTVSRAVGEGIKALQVAFPVMAQTPDDRAIAMKLYAEALESFHPAVQEFALKWIRLHNPRNTPTFTQPPTPQDLYELCKLVHATWKQRVIDYFLGSVTHSGFGKREYLNWGFPPPTYSFSSVKRAEPISWGAAPLTAGCDIPESIVRAAMIERTSLDHVTDDLLSMETDRYELLRSDFFAEGHKKQIDALRKEKCEREEAERRQQEYIDSLPKDLRSARLTVLDLYWRSNRSVPPEPEVIEDAKRLLQRQAVERAQRDSEWKAECERRHIERTADTATAH